MINSIARNISYLISLIILFSSTVMAQSADSSEVKRLEIFNKFKDHNIDTLDVIIGINAGNCRNGVANLPLLISAYPSPKQVKFLVLGITSKEKTLYFKEAHNMSVDPKDVIIDDDLYNLLVRGGYGHFLLRFTEKKWFCSTL